jgi:type IV secretory pathway VirB9-like protein
MNVVIMTQTHVNKLNWQYTQNQPIRRKSGSIVTIEFDTKNNLVNYYVDNSYWFAPHIFTEPLYIVFFIGENCQIAIESFHHLYY